MEESPEELVDEVDAVWWCVVPRHGVGRCGLPVSTKGTDRKASMRSEGDERERSEIKVVEVCK